VLGVAGAEVRAVGSSAEALATLGPWQPDVLLSGEGDSLVRALRSLPSDGRMAAFRKGFDARLSKPVEPVALLATVARLAA
jgi:CheY-like chemotaxis protein